MLPQLDPTWYASQAFWMLMTFCASFLVMWKAVLPRITSVVDERQRRLDDDMQTAEKFKTEAQSVQKEYQDAMAAAHENAKKILEETTAEISSFAEKHGKDFSSRLEQRIADGEAELAETKEQALSSVRDIAAGLIPDAAFKLSGIRPAPAALETEIAQIVKERCS